tara:strand:- start:629 stop:775 length:147 start_codon:yes stop_codon:yes gene_type:complete
MKKRFLIILVALLWCFNAYADATKLWNCLNASFVDVQNGNWDKFEKLS